MENNTRIEKTPLVYSRRKHDNLIDLISSLSFSHAQSSTPEIGSAHPLPSSSALFEFDLDISNAIRNGIRTWTKHPLSNFMSYHCLSPSYKAFTTNWISESIPNNIQETLNEPKWKEALCEEMRTLHKNETWEVVKLPCGKSNRLQMDVYH